MTFGWFGVDHAVTSIECSSHPSTMKVKMLKRNPADHVRETKHDIRKVHRDFSANLHPFEAAREYQRAVNAAKLVSQVCQEEASRDGPTNIASVHVVMGCPNARAGVKIMEEKITLRATYVEQPKL